MHEMEGPYVLPGTSHGLREMVIYYPVNRFWAFQGAGAAPSS
jgi:hypothetical protein